MHNCKIKTKKVVGENCPKVISYDHFFVNKQISTRFRVLFYFLQNQKKTSFCLFYKKLQKLKK